MGKNARTFGQDLMRGEHTVKKTVETASLRGGLTFGTTTDPYRRPTMDGTLMKSLSSSHPRYYEQKTAAEVRVGRTLTPEEFERDHWRTPDSEIISGTSIFDPVLCELAYRWFCPPNGLVLDPFAGGSVRGIVASKLRRRYIGIDLRPEQVAANEAQAARICDDPRPTWIVGDSRQVSTLVAGGPGAAGVDLVFSCPPYGDLEIYSDDAADLSTLDYPAFIDAYRTIVAASVSLLRPDRFACFVVGDLRDQRGFYRRFVSDTEQAFEDAGARLYNEAILVTSVGSLPIRVGRQFESARKLGKTHQNVLVFCNGDPRKATAAVGAVEFGELAGDGTVPPVAATTEGTA